VTVSPEPAGVRVLYIDDDVALCRLVTKVLERRGFAVATAHDGASGVERAGAEDFDVIAVDHYMPGLLGLQAVEQLKARGVEAPVVYVTGSDEIQVAVAALRAGAADYVIKSGSEDFPTLLISALEQAMHRVALERGKEAAESALRAANERLEAIVIRQAALLREVNHRVANSLQLVASLVHMQAGALKDEGARAALQDTQARIGAIMQVHRRLYTSDDVEFVDMGDYLEGLVAELEQSVSAGQERPIRITADPVRLQTDKAVSLGVVVTELVTNALKYAYPPGASGEVRIALRRQENGSGLTLVVEDDGRGMNHGEGPHGTGLGQKVVAAMARSLDSRVEFDPAHRGVRALLSFGA
jgi:two-component sensor histidine kinase